MKKAPVDPIQSNVELKPVASLASPHAPTSLSGSSIRYRLVYVSRRSTQSTHHHGGRHERRFPRRIWCRTRRYVTHDRSAGPGRHAVQSGSRGRRKLFPFAQCHVVGHLPAQYWHRRILSDPQSSAPAPVRHHATERLLHGHFSQGFPLHTLPPLSELGHRSDRDPRRKEASYQSRSILLRRYGAGHRGGSGSQQTLLPRDEYIRSPQTALCASEGRFHDSRSARAHPRFHSRRGTGPGFSFR